jgi:undecaprenyl-diphosphatase
MVHHLTYVEAMVIGLFQGVTELFPVSSLGHSVIIPALIGGSWARDLSVTAPGSPYLAFVVGLHVATAVAMIIYFWRDWLRIVAGFFTSIRDRRIETVDQRLAWMIILATIPVGVVGALLQHTVQKTFAKPVIGAVFLAINGVILLGGERLRRRQAAAELAAGTAGYADYEDYPDEDPALAGGSRAGRASRPGWAGPGDPGLEETRIDGPRWDDPRAGGPGYGRQGPGRDGWYQDGGYAGERQEQPRGGRHVAPAQGQRAIKQQEAEEGIAADGRLVRLGYARAIFLGSLQILALVPGISRDGVVMIGGMFRGLPRADAARFSFLLSAPVIFAAGALKIPDLMGSDGSGIRGQVLAGSIVSGLGAFLALRFLVRYLGDPSRTLTPFAIYCLVVGIGSAIYLA